jgi:hypothetical protein
MLASSWLDLVIGIDIHNHLVPTPAGPVPTPIPQPFRNRGRAGPQLRGTRTFR